MKPLSLTIAFAGIVALCGAQLPVTNVYVFTLVQTERDFHLVHPKYLTAFNAKGYNNQPYFANNNELYLTVQLASDRTQTDIFAFNLLTRTRTRLTATPESEYSPMLTPSRDGFSCVRADATEPAIQRLWRYPIDRSNGGYPVFNQLTDIGYYQWVNDTLATLFRVGQPNVLSLGRVRAQTTDRIISNIGRCFQVRPDGRVAYVQKATDQTWLIRALNTQTRNSETIIPTLPGAEDFVCLPDGTLLMASGSRIFRYTPGLNRDWVQIADLRFYHINNIKRIAVNRDLDKIAIVNED